MGSLIDWAVSIAVIAFVHSLPGPLTPTHILAVGAAMILWLVVTNLPLTKRQRLGRFAEHQWRRRNRRG